MSQNKSTVLGNGNWKIFFYQEWQKSVCHVTKICCYIMMKMLLLTPLLVTATFNHSTASATTYATAAASNHASAATHATAVLILLLLLLILLLLMLLLLPLLLLLLLMPGELHSCTKFTGGTDWQHDYMLSCYCNWKCKRIFTYLATLQPERLFMLFFSSVLVYFIVYITL